MMAEVLALIFFWHFASRIGLSAREAEMQVFRKRQLRWYRLLRAMANAACLTCVFAVLATLLR